MKKNNIMLLLAIFFSIAIIIFFYSCEDDDIERITTRKAFEITQTTALSGGIINSNRFNSEYNLGIVWDINPNPSLSNRLGQASSSKLVNGEFISIIKNLDPNTKYYVKAYATKQISYLWVTEYNESEIIYGEQIEFLTKDKMIGAGVIDIDNNEYSSVIIGEQEWMAENL